MKQIQANKIPAPSGSTVFSQEERIQQMCPVSMTVLHNEIFVDVFEVKKHP